MLNSHSAAGGVANTPFLCRVLQRAIEVHFEAMLRDGEMVLGRAAPDAVRITRTHSFLSVWNHHK